MILENKVVQKLELSKINSSKKCTPKILFLIENKNQKNLYDS